MPNKLLLFSLVSLAFPLTAQSSAPPAPPLIYEPAEGSVVSGEDVHMVAGGFSDSDGDEHHCTDWVIIDRFDGSRAWSAPCVSGFLAGHIHLGDGTFAPDLVQDKRLRFSHDYTLRVRFMDDSGDESSRWSDWSENHFRTTAVQQLAAMVVVDVLDDPAPRWVDETSGSDIVLPASSQAFARLENLDGEELLEVRALDGVTNQWIDAEPAAGHQPLRVVISAVTTQVSIPASRLTFTNELGRDVAIHLPEIELEPPSEVILWISANGSSHFGDSSQTVPDFSRIAAADPIPWSVRESGYEVELVAEGFQLPVAIEPVLDPGDDPDSPLFYVAELYGNVKVVSRDGTVTTYAESLLNFDPFGDFPGAGERGLADLAFEPDSGDLFVTLPHHPEGSGEGAFFPRVLRLVSSEDGKTMVDSEVVVDFPGDWIGPSHQISNISIGPDRKLYVHIADGSCIECARDLNSARGKIVRLELSGEPSTDNPFYDAADGITTIDYIYASGFRNPFGGAWRAVDGSLYEVENGPSTDRFVRVEAGADYGWEGDDHNMAIGALYLWHGGPAAAPVAVAFVQPETFDGSGFPWWKQDTAYVTESGPTWATGQPAAGKRIGEFVITAAGELGGERRTFVEYDGTGKSTVAALAAGPDGLYFSDLYSDVDLENPVAAGAKIFRVKHTGAASFRVELQPGEESECAAARFFDRSQFDVEAWRWRFGDGTTSGEQNPIHHFADCGLHTVELAVEGPAGERSRSVVIDNRRYWGEGLVAEYFADENLEDPMLSRIDSAISFDWSESPIDQDEGGFSARWSGWIRPRLSQIYRFHLDGLTGVRLWIDDTLVVDDWEGEGAARTGRFEMKAGRRVPIRIEARSEGQGSLELRWSGESQLEELVPSESLYPEAPGRRRPVGRGR